MQQRRRVAGGKGSGANRSRAPRRGLFWNDTLIDKTLAVGNTTQDSLDLGIPEDEKKGMTLTRLLIDITVVPISIGTGTLYHAGIYLCEDDAFGAGAIADAGQVGDDAGWIWRVLGVPVYLSVANDYVQRLRWQADIRAQRKYPGEDYTIILTQENDSSGLTNINTDGFVRALFKRA